VLEREGQPPLPVPYVEEQLGDGRFNLMTEANNQHIELWVAPSAVSTVPAAACNT